MAFIIGNYNKYDIWDREHSVYKFELNGNWYAIKEVELEWGKPQLPTRIENSEEGNYWVYESLEEARKFVRLMKRLN